MKAYKESAPKGAAGDTIYQKGRNEHMASSNVLELTSANWEQEVVKSDKPVLVDFWAVWCGPCRLLSPTIDKVADAFAGKVKVGKLNVDDAQDIAVRYRVSSIPQLFLFKGGDQPIEKLTGVKPEAEITRLLNRVLESA
jgi:thioredoxin 1